MPIETDLNINPYYDDYNETKDFHRVLFKPAVPLQARELTQLQTILQTQIERFGDYQFKEGTIIKGCSFSFDDSVKYAKILDKTPDTGLNVSLADYATFDYIREATSNLVAQVVDTRSGLESQTPYLATIFFHYMNTGDNSGTVKKAYVAGDTLEAYPQRTTIDSVTVSAGGDGFVNGDVVVIGSNGSIGSGASGTVVTGNANEEILSITFANTAKGIGYSITDWPTVTQITRDGSEVWSTSNTAGATANGFVGAVNLTKTGNVSIAGASFEISGNSLFNSVGSSYEMKVEEGVVYQRGHFQRFPAQTVIVSPYTKVPHDVSVGITTTELIANSSSDTSLLDNAAGFNNENAPGADRLVLTPVLTVNTTTIAKSSNNFLSFVDFQNGQRISQNQTPVLANANDELAKRTYEESGDYVVEPFRLTTETNGGNTTHFMAVVGPGIAYVKGKRFETIGTSRYPVQKATDGANIAAQAVSTTFGHYIKVNELVGQFGADEHDTILLLDTSLAAISTDNITSAMAAQSSNVVTYDGRTSTVIGTAKIRGLELESDNAGLAESVYQAYIYDIAMQAGKQFKNVKAIHHYADNDHTPGNINTAYRGIADIAGTTAKILDPDFDSLVFRTGALGLKTVGSTAAAKFKESQNITITNSTGAISTAGTNTFNFGTAGATLSELQEQQLIITARSNADSANISTVAVSTGNKTITGCVNTSTLIEGDLVKLVGGIGTEIRQVERVINSTAISVSSNVAANTSLDLKKTFVNNHVIPLSGRSTANVVISNSGKTLTINLGAGNLSTSLPVTVSYDKISPSEAGLKKTVQTSAVRINPSNNAGGVNGPWCLGIPDGLKIEAVYVNGSSTYNNTGSDVKADFKLDNGQKDGYYGLSYLRLRPGSRRTIATTDRIIVVLKNFVKDISAGLGFYTVNSYDAILNDKEGAAATPSNTNISIAEIPVFVSPTSGKEISLRDAVDFRPNMANTATQGAVASNTAGTENPAVTEVFATNNLVPVPNETWTSAINYYLPRKDRLVIENGSIAIVKGRPALNPVLPAMPSDAMQLGAITVPVYPSLDTSNARNFGRPDIGSKISGSQQKRYTMKDIKTIEKRVENLEYYASMNSLEAATADQTIPGRNDTTANRFKNGFLVDNFNTYTAGNPLNAEYKVGFDKARQILTSRFEQYNIKMRLPAINSGARSTVVGDIVTSSFKQKLLINQPDATTSRKCTSMFWEYNGHLHLWPDYVSNTDKTKSAELASHIDLDMAAPTLALIDELNKMAPAMFTSTEVLSETTVVNESSAQVDLTVTDTTETVVTTSSRVTNSVLSGRDQSSLQKVGDFITDISFSPYIPGVNIHFAATGLRPNLVHHVFFDQVNVDSHTRPTVLRSSSIKLGTISSEGNLSADSVFFRTGTFSSELKSNAQGVLYAMIRLPAGTFFTGKSDILVTDIADLSQINEKVSHAKGYFNSFNFNVTTAAVTLSTRTALVASSSTSSIVSTDQTTTTEDITVLDPPPAANNSANTSPPDDTGGDREDWEANTAPVTEAPANTGIDLGRPDIILPCADGWVNRGPNMGGGGDFFNWNLGNLGCLGNLNIRGMMDPLAQTFMVQKEGLPNRASTGFLSSIDLYFKSKDPNTGVTIELRETLNGAPAAKVLPFSRVHLSSSDINIGNQNTKTNVAFASPVAVNADTEYTIVILPDGNSPEYEVFTAKAGQTALGNAGKVVNNDWGQGTMFLSTNNRTWTEFLDEDMKFGVNCCVFTNSKSSVALHNDDYEFFTANNFTVTGQFAENSEVFKQAANQTGTVAYSTGASTLVGTGTSFTTKLSPGQRIVLQGNATSIDVVTVATVSSDTSATIFERPEHTASSGKFKVTPTGLFEVMDPVNFTSQIGKSTAANANFLFANGDTVIQAGNYGNGITPSNFQIGEVVDNNISYYQPQISRVEPAETTIVTRLRGKSTVGSGYHAPEQIKFNDTNVPLQNIKLMSRSNEIVNFGGEKSLQINHTMSSKKQAVSPIIDLQDQYLKIYENIINNDTTNEYKTYEGSADAKYVSRTITLAKDLDAEDIKVFVRAWKPEGTDVKVYAKIINQADTTASDFATWSELDSTGPNRSKLSSAVDYSDITEYTYEFKDTPTVTTKAGRAIINAIGTTTVTGAGTNFDGLTGGDYVVGDRIKIVDLNSQTDYQINTITAIASDTSMTVAEPMTFANVGAIHGKVDAEFLTQAYRDPAATPAYQVTYYNANGEKFSGYKKMAIKIVMTSTSTSLSPQIKDYRAIALSL